METRPTILNEKNAFEKQFEETEIIFITKGFKY